jgi:hypothetical protein
MIVDHICSLRDKETLKVLFALSGNQCANPECTNTLIEPATEKSDALVIAHICHIYAISTDGPRGKSGFTEEELNSPDNLILLCRNHHAVVDGQHETYPAYMLKKWKQTHESEMRKRLTSDLESIYPPRAHQLPGDLKDFRGHGDDVAALVDRLSKDGGAAAIPALNGLGGIGKSALAIHVAHRLKASYPAGQLFLELGGTSDTPLTPGAAMMQVILSVHPTAQLPNDETSVTAIYRDLLSSTKYLLVLDNARDAAQVSPLLQRSPCIFSIWRVHINP